MQCPNAHGEMPCNRQYVEVEDYGCYVYVYICQECQYSEAETRYPNSFRNSRSHSSIAFFFSSLYS